MRGGPLLDEGAVLNWADALVRAIREQYNAQADELIEDNDLFEVPSRLAARRAWVLQLEGERAAAWAELEERRRVWERVSLSWAEGRWTDVARLAARHCPDLPADAKALADRLRDVARAFPEAGRTAQALLEPLPVAQDAVAVPWGVDPAAPVLGPSPRADHRQVWQILREEFPGSGSARCTVATHRLLRDALASEVLGPDAQQWRREIAAALAAGIRGELPDEDRQWAAESLLRRVIAPLADERDRLAGAVADALALHQDTAGRCSTCDSPWPCTTVLALGQTRPPEAAGYVSTRGSRA
ncbi:hypothetical protein ABT224_19535 [Streptomyces sp. NPDC001584]|uniref:hypothetical protein n=1 Tax=Streptomyces sp. NPDC001584 TaxID=3154521 RepID=UPI003325DDC3